MKPLMRIAALVACLSVALSMAACSRSAVGENLTSADGSSIAQSETEDVSSAPESSSSISESKVASSTAPKAKNEPVESESDSQEKHIKETESVAAEVVYERSEASAAAVPSDSSSVAESGATDHTEHPTCQTCGATDHTVHPEHNKDTIIDVEVGTGFGCEGDGGNAEYIERPDIPTCPSCGSTEHTTHPVEPGTVTDPVPEGGNMDKDTVLEVTPNTGENGAGNATVGK